MSKKTGGQFDSEGQFEVFKLYYDWYANDDNLYFCFQINLKADSTHCGMGTHTKTILQIGDVYAMVVDFSKGGVQVSKWQGDTVGYDRTKTKSNFRKINYEIWKTKVSKAAVGKLIEDVEKGEEHSPKYNLVPIFPGKSFGQNCTTYAIELARTAGLPFIGEKIYGSNPKLLSNALRLRRGWEVSYQGELNPN